MSFFSQLTPVLLTVLARATTAWGRASRLLRDPKVVLLTSLVLLLLVAAACGAAATPTTLRTAATPTGVPLPPLSVATPSQLAAPVAASTFTPTVPQTAITLGGVINLSGIKLDEIDPNNGNFYLGNLRMVGNVWSTLIRVNPQDRATIEGDLAESWTASPDGMEYSFKILPGVVDHEGNPFTVDDAYYQMFRYVERPNDVPTQKQTCLRTFVKPIKEGGAEVTGADELTIRLKSPRGAFLPCLSGPFTAFLPSKHIKQIDASGEYRDLEFAKGELVGTGPFKFVELELENFLRLERFDGFFRDGLPYLDGINGFAIPDAATRVAAFRNGQIDAFPIFSTPTKRDADQLKAELKDDVVFPIVPAPGYRGFQFNVSRPPFGPQDDPKARKLRWAVQLALDRDEFNTLVFDGIGHLSTPYFIEWDWIYTEKEWLENFPGLDSTPEVKQKHLAEAQEIMQAEGFGPDNMLKTEYVCNYVQRECEVLADQLKRIYIDLDVLVMDFPSLAVRRGNGDFSLIAVSKGMPFPDPDAFNISFFFSQEDGGSLYSGSTNPEWRGLFEQQVGLSSREDRAPFLRDMAKIFYEEAAWIGIIRPSLLQGHRSNWRGYAAPPMHASNYTLESTWLAR